MQKTVFRAGQFVLAKRPGSEIWCFACVIRRNKGTTVEVLTIDTESSSVKEGFLKFVVQIAEIRLYQPKDPDNATKRAMHQLLCRVLPNSSKPSDDAMFRRLPGSYGTGRRR
ncbi:MAG: hypothetical protein HY986_13510 [Candidatus Melainabacteria bacterium]|jgi:hypothetical protein|nr:hypothetical protein [Candidatus Melainabacteria bacterium]